MYLQPDITEPVSYTHLDVYKRQLAHFMTKNLVKPIEQMAVDINDFSITPAYKEQMCIRDRRNTGDEENRLCRFSSWYYMETGK